MKISTEIRLAAVMIISLCTSLAQESLPAQRYDSNDAYQIYSVLLPQEESYQLGKGTLIIQEDTVAHPLEKACFDPKSASRFKDAISHYRSAQKHTWFLQRKFQSGRPYELVRSDTINLFFKEHGLGGWTDFYQRYPDSGGFVTLSPVGFNKSKTLAVVYTGTSCGTLCGRWKFHLLEKINGKWYQVPGVTCETMS